MTDPIATNTLPVKSNGGIAEEVLACRNELGLMQQAFCKKFGIPLKTLQSWEQKTRNPS